MTPQQADSDRLIFSPLALVISHKESLGPSSCEELEAVTVEMGHMPPICYIYEKLIYCIGARRIASDNSDIVSLCQDDGSVVPGVVERAKNEGSDWIDARQKCVPVPVLSGQAARSSYIFYFQFPQRVAFPAKTRKLLTSKCEFCFQ